MHKSNHSISDISVYIRQLHLGVTNPHHSGQSLKDQMAMAVTAMRMTSAAASLRMSGGVLRVVP